MVPLRRPHYFLLALLAAFFNPLVLVWYGTSTIFIVVVPITLLVWFAAKWDSFIRLDAKSSITEMALGGAIYAVNTARNVLLNSIFGVFDMLIVLIALVIAFFGIKAIKQHFLLPSVYLSVLVVSYQMELVLPEIQGLQNLLAQMVATSLNGLGIRATVLTYNPDVVTVWGRPGIPGPNPFSLWIENQCTGVKSMLAFGSLAILMIMDLNMTRGKKLAIALTGLVGTFVVNIGRLLAIFLSAYGWGVEAGLTVHNYLGYGLFIAWVLLYWTLSFKYASGPQTSLPQSTPQAQL